MLYFVIQSIGLGGETLKRSSGIEQAFTGACMNNFDRKVASEE